MSTVTVIFIALLNIKESGPKTDEAVLDRAFKIVLETVKMYEGIYIFSFNCINSIIGMISISLNYNKLPLSTSH